MTAPLSFYGALLLALHPLFSPEEEDAVKDNAAGSVARLVSAAAAQGGLDGQVPLDRVLPVLLSALPLKEDLEEAGVVYGCLLDLLAAEHHSLAPSLTALLSVLARVVHNMKVASEVRNRIGGDIQRLKIRRAKQWKGIVSQLSREERAMLEVAARC